MELFSLEKQYLLVNSKKTFPELKHNNKEGSQKSVTVF